MSLCALKDKSLGNWTRFTSRKMDAVLYRGECSCRKKWTELKGFLYPEYWTEKFNGLRGLLTGEIWLVTFLYFLGFEYVKKPRKLDGDRKDELL